MLNLFAFLIGFIVLIGLVVFLMLGLSEQLANKESFLNKVIRVILNNKIKFALFGLFVVALVVLSWFE
jgi:hypothetical protein